MWLQLVDLFGVAVFAVSGALAAGRKQLDLLGVVVIAIVASIGGGTLRDLLIDRPVFWLSDPSYLYVIISAGLATVWLSRYTRFPEKSLQVADALGLAFFSISGARIAESAGMPGVTVVVMGTITGVFGGVIRDVLCAEIPMILRKGNIYATAAIAGTSIYLLIDPLLPRPWPSVVGMLTIAGLRLSAVAWNLSLPEIHIRGGTAK